MLQLTHKLSAFEAEQIKEALLRDMPACPVDVAQELIAAFAVIDAATAEAAPSSPAPAGGR